jgi:hypothetical protein
LICRLDSFEAGNKEGMVWTFLECTRLRNSFAHIREFNRRKDSICWWTP